MPEVGTEAIKNRYLNSDKRVNLQEYLQKMQKEEASGLKGIEIREKPKQLGKDDFLKLLITQLSKQDPTNPVRDQDFIAQMANFSSLEQMKNVATSVQRLEAKQSYALIGKFVSGPDFLTGENVNGIVGAVFFDGDGKAFARVNGKTIEVEKINFISDPNFFEQEEQIETEKKSSNFMERDRNKKEDWNFPGKKSNNYK